MVRRCCYGLAISLHKFNFTRPPRLVEPRLQRPIKSQECIPAFAGNRLHPVDFLAGGSLWAKPDIRGLVVVDLETLRQAADAGKLLVGLEHRTSLVTVDGE